MVVVMLLIVPSMALKAILIVAPCSTEIKEPSPNFGSAVRNPHYGRI